MAVVVKWSGDGLSNGTFTTSSTGTGDTAPTSLTGSGQTVATGSLRTPCLGITDGTGTGYVTFTLATTLSSGWALRFYFRRTGASAAIIAQMDDASAAKAAGFDFNGSGNLRMSSASTGSNVNLWVASAATPTDGTWMRVEYTETSGGAWTVAYFTGDGTTAIESSSGTKANPQGAKTLRVGRISGAIATTGLQLDDWAVGDTSTALGPNVTTVPVTGSRATTWDTLASAASTRATTWKTRSVVSGTRGTTWRVAASLTSSRATTWKAKAAISSPRATTWSVRAAATSSRGTTWGIAGRISATRATTWHVRTTTSTSRATSWKVLVAVSSAATRSTTWNVAPPFNGAPVPTGLHVQVVNRARIDLTWDAMIGATGYEVERNGSIVASLSGMGATSYSDTGLNTGTAYTYRVRSTVTPTAPGAVTAFRNTSWDVAIRVTASRAAAWDIRVAVASTRATTWKTRATIAATRVVTWDTRKVLAVTRAASWNVLVTVAASKQASGLFLRGNGGIDMTVYNNNTNVDHVFLTVSWASISPNTNPATGGTYNWGIVDGVLSSLAPSGGKITLRIQAGDTAPAWLKTATGTVQLTNQARGITVNCCKWWTTTARNAWIHMINAAGVRYDSNPRVTMVSADLPMVVYSEPYILGGHTASAITLWNNGYQGVAAVETAITNCVDDTAAAFPNTLVELAIHDTLQYPTSTGVGYSWPEGRRIALALANVHGDHLLFSDYGLGVPDTLAAHTPTGTISTENDVYAWMYLRRFSNPSAPWAGPVGFQLTPNGLTSQQNYVDMAKNAADLGGQHCETSAWGSMTSGQRATADAALKANQFS